MIGVSKMYPPNKQVIRDISLSFYYGAKIGVLGLNGSGKSTLLKIFAGEELISTALPIPIPAPPSDTCNKSPSSMKPKR